MNMNKLLQLLRDNGKPEGSAKAVRSQATEEGVAIYIYDVIDPYWGACATDLVAALTAAGGQPVELHINSPGGDAFEGRAMAAAIANYDGPVEACIDGVCASAATTVALAAKSVCMVEGSLFMIHNAWTLAYGDKADLRSTADLLEKVDGLIAGDYMRKTGCTLEQAQAWMNAETWFTPAEALAAGFIDEIEPASQQGDMQEDMTDPNAKSSARWNLSAYANAPKNAPPRQREDLTARASAQLQANRNRLRLLAQTSRI